MPNGKGNAAKRSLIGSVRMSTRTLTTSTAAKSMLRDAGIVMDADVTSAVELVG